MVDEHLQGLPEAALRIRCSGVELQWSVAAKHRRRPPRDGIGPLDLAIVSGDLNRRVIEAEIEVELAQAAVEEAREVEELSPTQRREAAREDELPLHGVGRGELRNVRRDRLLPGREGAQSGSERDQAGDAVGAARHGAQGLALHVRVAAGRQ